MMTLAERFWSKVDIKGPGDCWEWQACRTSLGYGRFQVGTNEIKKVEKAPRVAWRLANGLIPNDLHVLHKCDNPPCCNPNHLFLGTHQDNMDDMIAKGRAYHPCGNWNVGEDHPMAKLSEMAVRVIKRARNLQITAKFLAELYHVKEFAIFKIWSGQRWRHVT